MWDHNKKANTCIIRVSKGEEKEHRTEKLFNG